MNIYIKDIINKFEGIKVEGNQDIVLENFSKDTRTIKEGDIYIGIKGESFDGNNFYKDAFDRGAKCCILNNDTKIDSKYKDKTIIKVEDTIKFIQDLARYKRSLYNIPVIAITGSVGKTSTKDMIYSVVSEKYKTIKTEGNYNNNIGVPLTILRLKDEEAIIVEMGMNHKGELSLLTDIAKPTIAVITNVGTAHIGNLGSRENILKAKLEILEGLQEDGILFINNDNDLLHKEYEKISQSYETVTIGVENDSDYKATNIIDNIFDSTFNIENKINNVSVYVGGKAFIYNSLIAYAIGDKLNIEKAKIKSGISKFKLSSHRLEKLTNKKGTVIIDDTYNASIDSMREAINLLGKIKDKRRIAIIGDMLELGEYSKQIHEDIGEIICDNKIDILITIGTYSKYAADRAMELGFIPDFIYGFDYEYECYDLLNTLLSDKDIVLIKGSHGINLVNVVNYLMLN